MTGAPVAGVWVALASQPKVVRARTDAKGQFKVTGVCSSSSTLITIRKEKFVPITVSTFSNTTGLSWVRAVLKSAGECRTVIKYGGFIIGAIIMRNVILILPHGQ